MGKEYKYLMKFSKYGHKSELGYYRKPSKELVCNLRRLGYNPKVVKVKR